MTTQYRPEGWENNNPCVECDCVNIKDRVCDMTCISLAKYEGKEAGADAMLEGLKKEGDYVKDWGTLNKRGYLVFIEEE